MEKNERMLKRWWLLGFLGLVLAGLLIACGSSYNSSSDGLLVVGSQGSGLLETFSFTLNNGSISPIYNTPVDTNGETCVLNGLPASMVMDPAGAYVYTLINANSACNTGSTISTTVIAPFKVNSDGTLSQTGNQVTLNQSVVPNALYMDAAGKFLFVANLAQGTVPGTVSVLAIGSGGSLTEVPGSPFSVPVSGTTANLVALAATPTVFPAIGINGVQGAVCSSGENLPTSEYLYAVDNENYMVWEFAVNTSTGVLSSPIPTSPIPSFATDALPAGVAVDPCDRFVYVSGSLHNTVSAYTICNGLPSQSTTCTSASLPPGALLAVNGSPFSLGGAANGPGPLVVAPTGNFVYVLDTLSNTISPFKISPVTGGLTGLNPATVATGIGPVSITIRADDNWMFVANYGSIGNGGNTVSQYSITPATGALNVQTPIQTDNYPWGVAVK